MTADAAADYCYGVEGAAGRRWGAEGARQALVARGCVAEAVSAAWVRNHFRWIVWSSAGLARRFPARWREFWSAERVLELLQGRYRREYECGERSALRRILEADAAPQRLMVLCIASVAGAGADVRVEVTDGWYGMQACADAVLARAIGEGRLRVGDKIACAGLGVRGVGDGVAPLSAEAQGAALLLTANCVRRGRWDAMLGFQRRATMAMALSAVHRLGGAVGATLDVVVVRRYPLRFMETAADGRRVVRSAKEEERVALAHAEDRAQRMLDLLEERRAQRGVAEADDEEALAERVEQELPQRQVHALLRMLVCDYPARPYRAAGPGRDTLAVVTVWRPGPIEPADLAEGSRVLLTGATVSPYRGGSSAATGLHLSIRPAAGCLRPAEADPHVVARSHYCRRATLGIDELQRAAAGEEVDVAGEVEQCCASASSQMLVLRLRSTGRDGSTCFADVEFPPSVFGCLSPPAGTTVTVRNCRILPPARDADAAVPRLHAGDVAEFAF
ncbi:Breast cancer 2, early onset [Coemansia helicoidea]|uniref:Breast cancer 2, early onset n=1 Tax=Coemansia helicoidea TaxID=1286919 RepID=A0ACC1LC14_9FUNG|nr:Breast cancer 2, early onset [Coemansia helicoidea]